MERKDVRLRPTKALPPPHIQGNVAITKRFENRHSACHSVRRSANVVELFFRCF